MPRVIVENNRHTLQHNDGIDADHDHQNTHATKYFT